VIRSVLHISDELLKNILVVAMGVLNYMQCACKHEKTDFNHLCPLGMLMRYAVTEKWSCHLAHPQISAHQMPYYILWCNVITDIHLNFTYTAQVFQVHTKRHFVYGSLTQLNKCQGLGNEMTWIPVTDNVRFSVHQFKVRLFWAEGLIQKWA